MASAVGSIIGGVLQGTGGAGSEFAPVVKQGVDNAMISQRPDTPDVKNAEVTPVEQSNNWQTLAEQANNLGRR